MSKSQTKKEVRANLSAPQPVHDVWAAEDEMPVKTVGKYNWPGICDQAAKRPGEWLLVDDAGARSTASNINCGYIAQVERFAQRHSYRFRARTRNGRVVEVGGQDVAVCEVWIKAEKIV